MSTRTILTTLLAAALTMPVMAQETPAPAAPPAPPAAAPAVTPAAEPAVPVAAVSRDKDTLSVDFPDEDIKTILRNVADLFELNLVVPDTLTGKTSIKLRDVTWEQIFQVVLSPVGYSYVKEGNIIKIVSNELLQQEPGSTEVFVLNNAKAADIKPTIDGLIDAATGGKIVIDGRSNALVITERPSRMGRIRGIIEKLDKATDQVMIESKFVEVTDRDVRNIGVNWASLQGMSLGVHGISQTFSRSRGQTTNDGTNSNAASGVDSNSTSGNGTNNGTTSSTTVGSTGGNTVTYVTGFNGPIASTTSLPGGAVTTSVTTVPSTTDLAKGPIASTTYNGTTTNDVTNGVTGSTNNTLSSVLNSTASNAVNQLMGLTNTGSTTRVASAVFSSSDFNVIISALKTQNNTKIVSNPTIVTLNNTEAFLNIGQEFPIPSYTYNAERGSFEVSNFVYKPIGIILKVTPQVNAQGVIKLTLEPEVSQQNGSTSFGGAGGASIPIIATRKVKTQVSLKDGYTMGIGGLITSSVDHGGTKVPVLGSIPVLGRLFSSKNINDAITNLLIFITAKTVTADGASPEEVFDPRAVRAVDISREDLPGYRAAKGTDVFSHPTNQVQK
jgi:type II secretory pathway component GspD/PulD (secretin)